MDAIADADENDDSGRNFRSDRQIPGGNPNNKMEEDSDEDS